jgi:HD superfamily phosphodiesterase
MIHILEQFIRRTCSNLGIDESHGFKHSVETVRYAEQLIDAMPLITEEERHMATFVAALHDLCDSKYTDVDKAAEEIRKWLIDDMRWTNRLADALISIVTSMSYSKLKKSVDTDGKPVLPDHGKWQLAYEIGRHADLLESYAPARCVMYNRHLYPEKSEDEHWARANELFEDRVFNYVKDGWISLPEALCLVPALEREARRALEERSEEWPLKTKID